MLSRNSHLGKIDLLRGVDKWGGVIARPAIKVDVKQLVLLCLFSVAELSDRWVVDRGRCVQPRPERRLVRPLIGLSRCMNSSKFRNEE